MTLSAFLITIMPWVQITYVIEVKTLATIINGHQLLTSSKMNLPNIMTFSFLPKFTLLDFVFAVVFTGSIIVSSRDVSFHGSFSLLCSSSDVKIKPLLTFSSCTFTRHIPPPSCPVKSSKHTRRFAHAVKNLPARPDSDRCDQAHVR